MTTGKIVVRYTVNMDITCECGCGQIVTGKLACGKPRRYVSGHNLRNLKRTEAHRAAIAEAQRKAWDRGRGGGGWGTRERMPIGTRRIKDGYVVVKVAPGKGEWRGEHVIVMERSIGRSVSQKEIVHHIDGDRANNSLENLFLCEDRAHHNAVHRTQDVALRRCLALGLVVFKGGVYECVADSKRNKRRMDKESRKQSPD